MDQHPIPRQITTFEFKLIGFLTLKQFIYLIVFLPFGYIVYQLFPIPLVNIVLACLVGGLGVFLAFVPINDRPADVWIRNFVKRLTSPTQYVYQKKDSPLYFLDNLVFATNPHLTLAHIESKEKLAAYLNQQPTPTNKKQTIHLLFQQPNQTVVPVIPTVSVSSTKQTEKVVAQPPPSITLTKQPFLSGVIKNHKLIPLPGILIYIKNEKNDVVRLLKTNPHGVFATFSPMTAGNYAFEFRDPKETYFFDTMKLEITGQLEKPLEFYSKELM